MPAKDVYKDNSYRYEFQIVGPLPNTSARGPKTGLVDVVGFMCMNPDGTGGPIHTDLQAAAAELSGKPGTYAVTIGKAAINARLYGSGADDHSGQTIYIVAMNADAESYSKIKVQAKAKPSG